MPQGQFNGDGSSDPERAPNRAVVVNLGSVQPRRIEWLWRQRIALGKLCVLAGRPGLGKSMLTVDVAARVSTGTPFTDCRDVSNPAGDVVILTAEDDLADTVRPRIDAAEGNPNRINCIEAVEADVRAESGGRETYRRGFALDSDLPRLEEVLDGCTNPRLVIVDPITAYLGESDSYKDANVRALLGPLTELAGRRRVAVVLVMHLNKSSASGQTALERVGGSIAFMGAARLAHLIERDSRANADPRTRLFLPLKSNITPETLGLAYAIEGDSEGVPRLIWSADPVALSADDAMRPVTNKVGEKTAEAATWLREQLADGAVYSDDLDKRRDADGISFHAFRTAKQMLGIKSRKSQYQGKWVNYLPSPDAESDPNLKDDGQDSHHDVSLPLDSDRSLWDSGRRLWIAAQKPKDDEDDGLNDTAIGPSPLDDPPINEAMADAIGAAGDDLDGIPF